MLDRAMQLLNRSNAFKRCLMDNGKLTPNGKAVLKDLATFCKAHESSYRLSPVTKTIDPLVMAVNEGRRDVWLRILWYLKIDEADLINLKEDDND